jgi:hypothetical protein
MACFLSHSRTAPKNPLQNEGIDTIPHTLLSSDSPDTLSIDLQIALSYIFNITVIVSHGPCFIYASSETGEKIGVQQDGTSAICTLEENL